MWHATHRRSLAHAGDQYIMGELKFEAQSGLQNVLPTIDCQTINEFYLVFAK